MSHSEEKTAASTEAKPAGAKGGLSIKTILVIGLFLGVVVGVECAIAAYMIPSAEAVAEMAEARMTMKTPPLHGDEEGGEHGVDEGEHVNEVALGEYGITSHQPATNTTIRIDFKLYGTVKADEGEHFDEAFAHNNHRLRDQVLVIVRNSESSDLTDPSLGLLKRRILEKSNRLLGKPFLKSVVFSDFSFIEQ